MSNMFNQAIIETAKTARVSTLASVAALAAFGIKNGITGAHRSDALALHVEGGHDRKTAYRHVAFGFKIASVVRAKVGLRQAPRVLAAMGANDADGIRDNMLAFMAEHNLTAASHADVWEGNPLEPDVVAEFRTEKAKAASKDKLTPEEKTEAEAKAAAARVEKAAEAKRLVDLAKMTPEELAAKAAADMEAKRNYELRRSQENFAAAMMTLTDQTPEALQQALIAINAEMKARKKAAPRVVKTLANLGAALAA